MLSLTVVLNLRQNKPTQFYISKINGCRIHPLCKAWERETSGTMSHAASQQGGWEDKEEGRTKKWKQLRRGARKQQGAFLSSPSCVCRHTFDGLDHCQLMMQVDLCTSF